MKQVTPMSSPSVIEHHYAGFWKRLAAFVIDMVILNLFWYGLIGYGLSLLHPSAVLEPAFDLQGLIFCWLYHVWFETMAWQATPGKMILGLQITTRDGRPITVTQSTIRFWMQFVSLIPFMAGYWMMVWMPSRKTLHDLAANTLVVETRSKSTDGKG